MKELWLFTDSFPYGLEESFLENELPVLCHHFDKVLVLPLFADGDARTLPTNAEVHVPVKDPYRSASLVELVRHGRAVLSMFASLSVDAPSLRALQANWRHSRSRMAQTVARASALEQGLMHRYDPARVLLYSFWSKDQVTALAILHQRDKRVRYISRMHGIDLYEDRNALGWLPLRRFEMDHVAHVFCASQAGLDHVLDRYPAMADRFELARLGTRDLGVAPWSPDPELRIASCSNAIPLKRIDLLIDALSMLTIPVQWIHFGGGPELERLRERAATLPSNVRATLPGRVPNAEVLRHHANHPLDLMVHLSSSEGGVAVALQEAASFGIPLLAADAGGVRELVGPETGTLLPLDVDAASVARHLEAFRDGPQYDAVFRAGVRAFWKQHFDAASTYAAFARRIIELHASWQQHRTR